MRQSPPHVDGGRSPVRGSKGADGGTTWKPCTQKGSKRKGRGKWRVGAEQPDGKVKGKRRVQGMTQRAEGSCTVLLNTEERKISEQTSPSGEDVERVERPPSTTEITDPSVEQKK